MSTRTLRQSVAKSLTVGVDKCTRDAAREATEAFHRLHQSGLAQPHSDMLLAIAQRDSGRNRRL